MCQIFGHFLQPRLLPKSLKIAKSGHTAHVTCQKMTGTVPQISRKKPLINYTDYISHNMTSIYLCALLVHAKTFES